MSEATMTTDQPPFVAEEGIAPMIVPATRAYMPPTAQAFFAVVNAAGDVISEDRSVLAGQRRAEGYTRGAAERGGRGCPRDGPAQPDDSACVMISARA